MACVDLIELMSPSAWIGELSFVFGSIAPGVLGFLRLGGFAASFPYT